MLKKYTSKSDIAISVLLANDKSIHVPFRSLTGGGSVLYTDDEELQAGLEHHPKFGHLFRLENVQIAEAIEKAVSKQKGEESNVDEQSIAEGQEDNGLKKIHVDNLDDAKEYLCDHFGESRTKLRSKKNIIESATANGIEFVGLDA
ncbi:MAG: hypothetical protein MSS51_08545 [Bacteroidales bacterium]|nr:hypothetical protein [Bacteroidales bacterium]